jgi:hypothetical protein
MPLMQDEPLIQTLPPDTAKEPFHIRMLPPTLGSGLHCLDAPVLDPLSKGRAVDAIAVAEQIPGHLDPRERFDPLLCRLWGGRMLR